MYQVVLKELSIDCKRMSQTKKKYTLGKINQLIDLNGDSVNFDITFTVTCDDDTPFNVLVVDQRTLDNTPDLEYKETKKVISGNIIADKNMYQNYFLILKSEKTCSVDVEIVKKELPRTPEPTIPVVPQVKSIPSSRQILKNDDKTAFNWKKMALIGIVVIAGLFLLWYLYKRKVNKDGSAEVPVVAPVASVAPVVPVGDLYKSPTGTKQFGRHSPSNSSLSPDLKTFKPQMHFTKKSPDVMSQASSVHSPEIANSGNTLLDRLRKFAKTK